MTKPTPHQTRLHFSIPALNNILWAGVREDDPVTGYGQLVNAVWREVEKELDIKLHPTFSPTRYAIPEAQWIELASWVQALDWPSDIDRATAAMDWIDRSPSHYPHTDTYPTLEK